ncbi:MAG: CDP-alcohol phosphatidyltransferase family protein [Candidatus Eiseniibacteriota bacterium]
MLHIHAEFLGVVAGVLLLLTMPVFAAVSRGRPHDPDVASRPRTALLGYWVRDWLMWVISPLERLFLALRVPPIAFNWAGVALGAAAGVAYALGAFPLGGWLVLLGGAADIFDGRIARARGMASKAGAFLDSTLDRFAETFAFAGLAVWFRSAWPGVLMTVLALGGSLLVSYARARGEGLGVHYKGGLMQRAERLVLLALASLLEPVAEAHAGWPPGRLLFGMVAFIGLASLATALHRTVAIARALEREEAARG